MENNREGSTPVSFLRQSKQHIPNYLNVSVHQIAIWAGTDLERSFQCSLTSRQNQQCLNMKDVAVIQADLPVAYIGVNLMSKIKVVLQCRGNNLKCQLLWTRVRD